MTVKNTSMLYTKVVINGNNAFGEDDHFLKGVSGYLVDQSLHYMGEDALFVPDISHDEFEKRLQDFYGKSEVHLGEYDLYDNIGRSYPNDNAPFEYVYDQYKKFVQEVLPNRYKNQTILCVCVNSFYEITLYDEYKVQGLSKSRKIASDYYDNIERTYYDSKKDIINPLWNTKISPSVNECIGNHYHLHIQYSSDQPNQSHLFYHNKNASTCAAIGG